MVTAEHRILVEWEVVQHEERAVSATERRPAHEHEDAGDGKSEVDAVHSQRRRRETSCGVAAQREQVALAAAREVSGG
jgi:hypothetical protein